MFQRVDQIEHVLLLGDPVKELCKLAEASNIDLIVVGSHGRTGLRGMLLGSVAQGIIRSATVPVITIKSNSTLTSDDAGADEKQSSATSAS